MKIHRMGNLRGDKVRFDRGVEYCVWYPIVGEDEEAGVCFDFPAADIDDLIDLLCVMKGAEAEEYEKKEDGD